jgi:hypothetical protein
MPTTAPSDFLSVRNPGIDLLRGLSILLVILVHIRIRIAVQDGPIDTITPDWQLIVEETNAIGTAYQRLDLLPAESQPELRQSFRQYLDSRLESFRRLPDLDAATRELEQSAQLQDQIWRLALAACARKGEGATTSLVVSALNDMMDTTAAREMAARTHPPRTIYLLLFVLALASALFAGHDMASAARRSWVHMIGFSVIVAVAVYVILDLEYPRIGWIRVDAADRVLVELRSRMN